MTSSASPTLRRARRRGHACLGRGQLRLTLLLNRSPGRTTSDDRTGQRARLIRGQVRDQPGGLGDRWRPTKEALEATISCIFSFGIPVACPAIS